MIHEQIMKEIEEDGKKKKYYVPKNHIINQNIANTPKYMEQYFMKLGHIKLKANVERVLKLRIGRLISESKEWKKPEKYQFYARINELKELEKELKL